MLQKWLDRLPLIVLHTLLIALPLVFTTRNDELFEFPKVLIIYGGAILLFFSWIRRSLMTKSFTIPRTPFDLPILLFLASQFLSTIFSLNPHTSWFGYYSRFNGGLLSVLSYIVLFYGFVDVLTKENLSSFFRSMLLGGVFAGLYAFPEHFGGSPSCYLITGNFNVDCWVQDVQSRVFGTLGQPNWLGAYMVVLLPLSVVEALRVKSKELGVKSLISYLLPLTSFLLFSCVLLFTKSRSGILGAVIGLVMFCGLSILFYFRNRVRSKELGVKSLISYLLPLISFCILLFLISNPVRDKLLSFSPLSPLSPSPLTLAPATGTQLESGGSESGDIRKVVWTGALKVWMRYPILGSGVETFAYSYYRDRPVEHNLLSEWDFLYNKAHNEFLNYLATTGIVGLLSYILMYGSFVLLPIVWIFQEKSQHSLSTSYYLLATASSLTGLAISNFFGFSTVVVSFLTFVLPAFAVTMTNKKKISSLSFPTWIQRPLTVQILYGIALLMTAYWLLSTYRLYTADLTFARGKQLMSDGQAQDGVALIQDATDMSPDEPVYRDELAYTAARLSYLLSTSGESTKAAQLAQAAIDHSDLVLAQNSVNVNFYKTRVRIFSLLAQISPVFYDEAVLTLKKARELSPTDPKLTYNLALIAKERNDLREYEHQLLETIQLRSIDLQSILELGMLYEEQKKPAEALNRYKRVLQLDPKNETAKSRIASLSATQKK